MIKIDNEKAETIADAAIFIILFASFLIWVRENPKRWFIVLAMLVVLIGGFLYEEYKEEQEDIASQLEKCPTCPVWVGDWPDYYCIMNCK